MQYVAPLASANTLNYLIVSQIKKINDIAILDSEITDDVFCNKIPLNYFFCFRRFKLLYINSTLQRPRQECLVFIVIMVKF